MVNVTCPIAGCDYSAENEDNAIVAALLQLHATQHAPGARGAATVNLKKPERPTIVQDMSEGEWGEFKYRFDNYKRHSGIVGNEEKIRSELQECCEKQVRSRIFQMKGSGQFGGIEQCRGETPQNVLAKLRAKADKLQKVNDEGLLTRYLI